MDIKTIFDGWGTELISIIIGILIAGGGFVLFKKGRIRQKQKASSYTKQNQMVKDSSEKDVSQKQEAGDNSEQTQIG
jgi:lipopolysaccharide/colanic/teichoic acid biosynthesis glycosyltransferase